MAETTSETNNPFNHLPIELRCCILAFLPDLQSLVSSTLTCHALHDALMARQTGIIQGVLINCIGLGSLPEAIIAHQCSPPYLGVHGDNTTWPAPANHLDGEQKQKQFDYISKFLQRLERPSVPSNTWTMRDALTLGNFHFQIVLPLTKKFTEACARTISNFPIPLNGLSSRPMSRSEEDRIARAFYRFEMFRRLFGCFNKSVEAEVERFHQIFFFKFAPWENAQLGCIHDFLHNQISPAADAIVGACADDLGISFGSVRTAFIQHLLTIGLDKFLEITFSRDVHIHVENLLTVESLQPYHNRQFLQDAIRLIGCKSPLEGIGKALLEATPFCVDEDAGPEKVHELLFEKYSNGVLGVYNWLYDVHWDIGYVMWDRERLDDISILQSTNMATRKLMLDLIPGSRLLGSCCCFTCPSCLQRQRSSGRTP
ncbi:hypothetical protein F4779DRAFT_561416 [Xylariaceae sp. FL0662B]|nr:hypothetical protein F4779DRAFT_561416 [Xylariaceae sp. FL0662B]